MSMTTTRARVFYPPFDLLPCVRLACLWQVTDGQQFALEPNCAEQHVGAACSTASLWALRP